MKKIIHILLLFIVIGCGRNNEVTIDLFNPNPALTPDDVYGLNLERINGVDIDMFAFKKNDTTIIIETGDNMVFGQRWEILVDNTTTLDEVENFFAKQYNIITLSKDTIIDIDNFEEIIINAYSKNNNLHFDYSIDPYCYLHNLHADYNIYEKRINLLRSKILVVHYTFPEYEEYRNAITSNFD